MPLTPIPHGPPEPQPAGAPSPLVTLEGSWGGAESGVTAGPRLSRADAWQEQGRGPGCRVGTEDLGRDPAGEAWAKLSTMGTCNIRPLAAGLGLQLAASEVRHWAGRGSQWRPPVTPQGGDGPVAQGLTGVDSLGRCVAPLAIFSLWAFFPFGLQSRMSQEVLREETAQMGPSRPRQDSNSWGRASFLQPEGFPGLSVLVTIC